MNWIEHVWLLGYRIICLDVLLHKFLKIHNTVYEEPGVASWKLALKVDGPEQVFKDLQVLEANILLL